MTQGVETSLEGTTLIVRIPMKFPRRGGRKRIVAPDGDDIVPSSKPQPDRTLVEALARAWRWQKLLDEGICTSVSEIGEAEGIGISYVSRLRSRRGPTSLRRTAGRQTSWSCRGSPRPRYRCCAPATT
jgi:hypothetical protein